MMKFKEVNLVDLAEFIIADDFEDVFYLNPEGNLLRVDKDEFGFKELKETRFYILEEEVI